MLNLYNYKEKIDVEFDDVGLLDVRGIKVDGRNNKSLKEKLDLSCLKSCDYIRFKGHKTLILIENSDLGLQLHYRNKELRNLIEICKTVEDKTLSKAVDRIQKRYDLAPDELIINEFKSKYKDSLLIVSKIASNYKIDLHERFDKKIFYVVINILNPVRADNSIALDRLKRKIELRFKNVMGCVVNEVEVLSPSKLVKKLKGM